METEEIQDILTESNVPEDDDSCCKPLSLEEKFSKFEIMGDDSLYELTRKLIPEQSLTIMVA